MVFSTDDTIVIPAMSAKTLNFYPARKNTVGNGNFISFKNEEK